MKSIDTLTKKEFQHRINTDVEFHKREIHRLKQLSKITGDLDKKYDLKYYVDLHSNQVSYKILKSKHRRGVEAIVKRLEEHGWINIHVEEEFAMAKIDQRTGRPVAGECDVRAEKYLSTGKHYLGVFEYKSNNKSKHVDYATIQLCKDYIQFNQLKPRPDKTVAFFVYGDKPTYKRIKKYQLESVVWNHKF